MYMRITDIQVFLIWVLRSIIGSNLIGLTYSGHIPTWSKLQVSGTVCQILVILRFIMADSQPFFILWSLNI